MLAPTIISSIPLVPFKSARLTLLEKLAFVSPNKTYIAPESIPLAPALISAACLTETPVLLVAATPLIVNPFVPFNVLLR